MLFGLVKWVGTPMNLILVDIYCRVINATICLANWLLCGTTSICLQLPGVTHVQITYRFFFRCYMHEKFKLSIGTGPHVVILQLIDF